MIPSEITARDLMFAAPMNDWRLELKSTNWLGYWIIQLTSESHELVEMLINFDQLTAICTGMHACIDVANNPSQYPRATTMLQTVAVELPTQDNNDGAITILSDWEEGPYLNINYYRSRNVESPRITQALSIEDAQGLYNLFANIYNEFPAKMTWTPRQAVPDNVFKVLGIQSREDCVSNAIAYAFNSCIKFRESFLRAICEKRPDDYSDIKALTRVSIAGHGIPDLVLVCASHTGTDLIVIENKLGADEGEDQTTRYASEPFRELLRCKLCPDKPSPRWTFIFLTLFPDQEAASDDFTHKSYELLAGTVSEYAHPDSLAADNKTQTDWQMMTRQIG